MLKQLKWRHVAAVGLLAYAALLHASNPERFAVTEIAPGIFLHAGAHATVESPARGDIANLAWVVGERCVGVIDTGGSIATGSALAAAIAEHSGKPVCYVINTHVHFDHVLGNAAFRERGAQFAGHQGLAESIPANRQFFSEAFAEELGGADGGSRIIGPDVLVEDILELDLGNRILRLKAHPAAHSDTDLTVLDVTTSTLFAGDLLFRERMPVVGSVLGWIAWMEQAMKETYNLVVPGHGPVDPDWPAGAADQYRYLKALRDDTRKAVAEGVFIEDAKDRVATDEPERWKLSDSAHGGNVSRAYRELEWE